MTFFPSLLRWRSMLFSGLAVANLLLPLNTPAAQKPEQRWLTTVTHVSDGDTLWVQALRAGEAPLKIRLMGIDAPELCQNWGPQAHWALSQKLLHQRVELRFRAHDRYGRWLGRVWLQGEDVGAWMVLNGHAWSDGRHRQLAMNYAPLQAEAQRNRQGLFSQGPALQPQVFRKRHGPCH